MKLISVTLAGPGTGPIIGDALRSVEPLTDSCLVVWTGQVEFDEREVFSASRTAVPVEALRWNAWRWRDDYGAARNAGLVAAEGNAEWACSIDTDERAVCTNPTALRAWLVALPDYVQVVLAYHHDRSHTRERFFRLPARHKFVGRTHEMYHCPADQQAIAPYDLIYWTELPKSREQLRAKFRRDADMLRADLADNPTNGAALHYLGLSLQSLALYDREDGREDDAHTKLNEAIGAFREHRRIDTAGAPAWHEGTAFSCYRAAECYLALDQPDRAIDCALAGMALDAGIAELPWIAAVASLQVGRLDQAQRWAELAKTHAAGSDAERRRVGFKLTRGLTTGPDEVLAAVASMRAEAGTVDHRADRDTRGGIPISPDGAYYLRAATGVSVPKPYSRRWLLSRLLGPHPERWRALTLASFALLPLVAAGYFHARGLAGWPLLFAAALLCALPGLRLPLRLPVLLDAPSFVGTLAVAWSASAGPWWLTATLALLLGATRETGPVFAALWSWSPWPLVGLLAVGWWRPHAPADETREPWLVHPVREAWALRRRIGLDGGLYLRPWGAALAGLLVPSWQALATLAVAHAQLLAAVDTVRLAVWAAPPLVLAAAHTIPMAWWPIALLVTLVHREDRA